MRGWGGGLVVFGTGGNKGVWFGYKEEQLCQDNGNFFHSGLGPVVVRDS